MSENRIKERRKAKGLSLEELAERLGTTHGTIYRIERGETRLFHELLPALANELGVKPSELANLGETKKPIEPADDAEPFIPQPGHPLFNSNIAETAQLWLCKSNALDAIGLLEGDVLIVDTSVNHAELMDGVLIRVQKSTLLRQHVEPDLFITNSKFNNKPIINRKEETVAILGRIESRFAPLKRLGR